MGYTLDKDGIKDIKYCDYVEITDVNDDEYIYNVFYSDEYGLCLYAEDEPLIKFLHIRNSRLESYYVTGEVRVGQKDIKTIVVDMTTGYSRKIKVLPYMEHCFNIIMKWE